MMSFFQRLPGLFPSKLPESTRRAIYLEYDSKRKTLIGYGQRKHPDELSDYELSELGDIISGRFSAATKLQQWQREIADAEGKAMSHTTNKFAINERQLRAIIQEAKDKKWE